MSDADVLHWLPAPIDLGADIRELSSATDGDRVGKSLQLLDQRLDYFQTIQVERAIGKAFPNGIPGFPRVRLALLSDFTVEHLLPSIKLGGWRRGISIETYVSGFGQFRQELGNSNSGLHAFQPNYLLFSFDWKKEINTVSIGASAAEVDRHLEVWIAECSQLWALAKAKFNGTIIQETSLNTAFELFGQYDAGVPAAPSILLAKVNDTLRRAALDACVLLLDLSHQSSRLGTSVWFDLRRWYQAKQAIAPAVAPLYGDLLGRLLAAHYGRSRKCLILDLDNTIWGGVIGDDGIDGIVLGQGNAAGEAFVEFQRYVKALSERGIILAVCSKNNPEIAEAAFRDHPEMVLKRADISAFVANWRDKPTNIREIASTLNIGLDSLVFFDDNPFERESVRQSLPMVAVPEVPDDCALYVRCLSEAGYFETVSFTAEDRDRVRSYAANTERKLALTGASNTNEFLRGLGMRLKVSAFEPIDLPRVAQLIGKTNQFNVTTKRYSLDEVRACAEDCNALTFQARLLDRLGDNGLISVVILRAVTPKDPTVWIIDTWLMSCRVLGRDVEKELCNMVVETAAQREAQWIIGRYVPTEKNVLVRDLFKDLGFTREDEDDSGGSTWKLSVSDYQRHHTHIVRGP